MERVQKLVGHLQPSTNDAASSQDCSGKEYKYTLSGHALTDEQRAFYDENGFIVVKGLLSMLHVLVLENRLDGHCLP